MRRRLQPRRLELVASTDAYEEALRVEQPAATMVCIGVAQHQISQEACFEALVRFARDHRIECVSARALFDEKVLSVVDPMEAREMPLVFYDPRKLREPIELLESPPVADYRKMLEVPRKLFSGYLPGLGLRSQSGSEALVIKLERAFRALGAASLVDVGILTTHYSHSSVLKMMHKAIGLEAGEYAPLVDFLEEPASFLAQIICSSEEWSALVSRTLDQFEALQPSYGRNRRSGWITDFSGLIGRQLDRDDARRLRHAMGAEPARGDAARGDRGGR